MSNHKKVCFILPSFIKDAKGGSEIQAYYIAQELLRRGWEVHYIRENNKKIGKEEIIEGIIVHSLPPKHTKLKWLNFRPLTKMMKTIKADVWYCRGTTSYLFPVWKIARKVKGKVLWACSNDIFLLKYLKSELRKESSLRRAVSYLDRYLFLWALKKIDLIILQTSQQKKMLEKNWKLKGEIIFNGYPLTSSPSFSREPLILWIGRLQHLKHPERFALLAPHLKNKPYKLLALGRRIEDIGSVQEFVKVEKKMTNFKYLGEVEREKVFHLLQKAKLLINTSDYEGFSNTFIEAWFHGVPIVSLKVDPDDMIKKNGLGRVSGSLEQMAKDVEILMENQSLWEKMSKHCQQFAEKNFNIIDKVTELEKLITNLDKKE